MELQDNWTFYEHTKSDKNDYDKHTKKIITVNKYEDFMNIFKCMLKPSEIFYQKDQGKPYHIENGVHREISSLSIFKNDITPKWEDVNNKNGGEFIIKKNFNNTLSSIDNLWNTICNFMISSPENINGIRVVDSSIPLSLKQLYRVEIWIDNLKNKNNIEKKILKIIDKHDKLEFKEHKF